MKKTSPMLFMVLLGAVLFGESAPQQASVQPEIPSGKLVNAIRLLNTREVSYRQDNALFPAGYTQQPTTPPQAMGHADPIVGAWKLDVDKSTNPTAEAEILTITPQEDQFKLTFVATQSNRYNPHYEVVTDMKGAISKPTDSGKPMNDAWCFTRNEPNVFVQEGLGPFGGWKKEYAVSADGKTLTVHELPGNSRIIAGRIDSKGVIHPVQHVLVFEKIPESEGQRLVQEMVDLDAAQKALGAEKAAAQAALDAVACSMAPGQAAAPESTADQIAAPGWVDNGI